MPVSVPTMDDLTAAIAALQKQITALTPPPAPIPTPVPTPAPSPATLSHYVATITLADGSAHTFDSAKGTDIGSYIGPFVQQRCIKVPGSDAATAGFIVYFRPDVAGNRDEVVVEFGTKPPPGVTLAHILQPYSFAVTKDGAALFNLSVDHHWWAARWRWQSAPRPLVRNCADLIAQKLLLPYVKDFLFGAPPFAQAITWSGPMGTAGLMTAMATVGDRPEIGPMTLPQSDYVINGTPAALTAMMAQAEAAGTMGFYFRDSSGAWIDFTTATSLTIGLLDKTIPMPPNPPVPAGMTSGNNLDPRWFNIETSHMPAVAYLPYLLTDDPYFLEALQAQANFGRAISAYHPNVNKLPGLVYPGETRSWAWSVRSLMQAAKVTPASVPSWLRPASYFQTMLADNLTYGQRFMASPCKAISTFHFCPFISNLEGFEADYLGIIFVWMLRMGFSAWVPFIAWWFAGNLMPFVSDGSGWKKGWPDPYGCVPFSTPPGALCLVSDTHLDSVTYPDYATMFQDYVTNQGYTNDANLAANVAAWDGVSIMQNQSSAAYYYWRSGALHLANGAGIAGAAAAMAWLDSQIPVQFKKYNETGDQRFSFASAR